VTLDQKELLEAIEHEQKMLHVKQRRLRELELQAAQLGIDVRPAIKTEIYDLAEEIERHQERLAQLRTEAVVDKEPLHEVEYRMLVAEAWDTPEGRPRVAAAAKVEYHRLRLGVPLARAQEIIYEIKIALVQQLFRRIHMRFYSTRTFNLTIPWDTKPHLFPEHFDVELSSNGVNDLKIIVNIDYPQLYREDEKSMDALVKCIYLDYDTTLKMYIDHFSKQPLKINGAYFEPAIPDNLEVDKNLLTEFSNKSYLLDELFRTFGQNLYASQFTTGFGEEYKQIGKFVNDLYNAVVSSSELCD
jgi:hypothetical protein